jgi:very-short-patch-repair endonuclease
MLKTRGVTRISSTAEGQKKMLANRKISGKYKFQDGGIKEYTGSYELKALEFMDKVLHIKSDDILSPGPILEYTYEGKVHMYITDFYYQPYNLVIEVKDGGDNPNRRNMPEYRGKQIAKERFIINHTNFNYLRLTNNDLSQLLAVFADLKYQLIENTGERVIHVNETTECKPVEELMNAIRYTPIVGITDADAYIIHNTQNNVFSVGVGTHFTDVIGPDNSNKLNHIEIPKEDYDKLVLYKLPIDRREVSTRLKNYMGETVDNKFVYEKLMNQTMYTYDQIQFQGLEVIDLNPHKKYIDNITEYCSSELPEKQAEVVYNVVEEIAKKYNLNKRR